jgi:hypothetical protein
LIPPIALGVKVAECLAQMISAMASTIATSSDENAAISGFTRERYDLNRNGQRWLGRAKAAREGLAVLNSSAAEP